MSQKSELPSRVALDADEFGAHVKAGGWRLGLLVARNVTPAKPGKPDALVTRVTNRKVSAQEFGRRSGTSAPRVLRYLTAWDNAADAGIVPASADLSPGQDIALDVDTLPDWTGYYPPGETNYARADGERREAFEKAAAETGTTPSSVARAAASPNAVAGAIKADPKVAVAAREALGGPTPDEVRKAVRDNPVAASAARNGLDDANSATVKQSPDHGDDDADGFGLMVAARKVHRDMDRVLTILTQYQGGTIEGHIRTAFDTELAWLRNSCEAAASLNTGGGMDAQISAFLASEVGR